VSSSGDGDEAPGASDAGDADEAGSAADADAGDDEQEWWEDAEPDPPSLGPDVPSVDVPEVDVPAVDSEASGVDVDAETARGFWRLVLVFDVALLALSLGPMFIYFQGNWRRGGLLLGFGLCTFLYGVARYREFRDAAPDPDAEAEVDGDGDGDPVEEA
jgi:hypothetical protein